MVMDFIKEAFSNGEIKTQDDLIDVLNMPADGFSMVGHFCSMAHNFEDSKTVFEAAYEAMEDANEQVSRKLKERQENGGLDSDSRGAADGK